MSYFSSAQEVDCYIGGVLRLAAVHPVVSRVLARSDVVLGICCTEPDARIVVSLTDPVTVSWGDDLRLLDIELTCPADVLDGFFRGRVSLLEALGNGTATARGRISKVLKMLPELELFFPVYRELVAAKDNWRGVFADAAH